MEVPQQNPDGSWSHSIPEPFRPLWSVCHEHGEVFRDEAEWDAHWLSEHYG